MTSRERKYHARSRIYTKRFDDGTVIHVKGYSAKTLRRIREAEKKYLRTAATAPLPKMAIMVPHHGIGKPPGNLFNYEALLAFAKKKYPELPAADAITKCMDEFSASCADISNMPRYIDINLDADNPLIQEIDREFKKWTERAQ